MLVLGLLYALGFVAILGISMLVDGGQVAGLYLGTVPAPTREMLEKPDFQMAVWVTAALYLPFSLMFWHAPALVHWHQVPPIKSVFFSLVACLRNFWAFTVFGLVWLALLVGAILLVSLLAGLLGSPQLAGLILLPGSMLIAAMFFTSTYFTFRDCFQASEGENRDPSPAA